MSPKLIFFGLDIEETFAEIYQIVEKNIGDSGISRQYRLT
jgi:hypothetical protein